jgi:putative polyketide hydroxylase
MSEVPIIICGAGPVGLTLSILLSRLGIQNTLIEKHPGTAIHPKARGVNVRTMEIFSMIGIEKAIRQHELPKETRQFLWLENIQGNVVASVKIEDDGFQYSPTSSCFVTQDNIEKELLQAGLDLALSDIRFSTCLTKFTQNKNGVSCTLFNTSTEKDESLDCQYLIACDGAHSTIRKALSIQMVGDENLGDFLSVYCNVDLGQYLHDKLGVVTVFTDESVRGKFIMAVDHKKKWVIAERLPTLQKHYDDDYCKSLVQQVASNPSLPINIINTSVWQMAALNASQYRIGNIFLAGDAAHRIPPTGGMGMNAGIQDAQNLAWKLASVLKKEWDESLLDTYFQERHAFNQYVIDWSTANATRLRTMYTALQNNDIKIFKDQLHLQKGHVSHMGLDLGFTYSVNSTMPTYENMTSFDPNHYDPIVKIGMRAPHAPIRFNEKIISTLNLFEDAYVILAGENIRLDEIKPMLPLSSNMTLHIYVLNKDFFPADDTFNKIYKLLENSFVLVRPDGYVAYLK